MRISKILGFALVASVLLMPTRAKADVIFAIDMDTAAEGIQTSRSVSVGDTFDVALVVLLTGGSQISAFALGIDFDQVELQVQSVSVSGRPPGYDNVNVVSIDNAVGRVRPFDALPFFPLSATSTVLGVLTIQAVAPTTDGFAYLTPAFQVVGIDGALGGSFEILNPGVTVGDGGVFFQAGSIDVANVPEPSSTMALVALLGGVVGVRRFRRNKKSSKD